MDIYLRGNRYGIISSLGAFDAYRHEIRKIVCAPGTTVLATGAISGLDKLEDLILPDTLVEIQNDAVSDCPSLHLIFCPPTVRIVGEHAFTGCARLCAFHGWWLLSSGYTDAFVALHRAGLVQTDISVWHRLLTKTDCSPADRRYASVQLLIALSGENQTSAAASSVPSCD